MLGRNWCADDVTEATEMGETTVRASFNCFCDNFVTEFYESVIYRPEGLKLAKTMGVYERMGLPGCNGSTDCVHVEWYRYPVSLHQLCKGKECYPSLAYSCTVDHHRRILGMTSSNFGIRNDKFIVRLDTYITNARNQLVHSDTEFEVFMGEGLSKTTGVYYSCVGGYHKWTCMMKPMKQTSNRDERLWSEWVESVRKDVDCCFGTLKGRFRILRNGMLLQTRRATDQVLFTCCILHNLILGADGLDARWEQHVEWDTLNPQVGNMTKMVL